MISLLGRETIYGDNWSHRCIQFTATARIQEKTAQGQDAHEHNDRRGIHNVRSTMGWVGARPGSGPPQGIWTRQDPIFYQKYFWPVVSYKSVLKPKIYTRTKPYQPCLPWQPWGWVAAHMAVEYLLGKNSTTEMRERIFTKGLFSVFNNPKKINAKIWWISALEFKKRLNQTIKGTFTY